MTTTRHHHPVSIEADPTLPIIRITRDFDATPAELMETGVDEGYAKLDALLGALR